VLARLNTDFNWSDAPVEYARIFVARVNEFMKSEILLGPEIVGKVLHYIIRYEEQSKGSLHAHIMLWTAENSFERVWNEIVAVVPAFFDIVSGEFVRPTSGPEQLLFDVISKKHMHVCRPNGCMFNRDHCKYGFPAAVHSGTAASFSTTQAKWEYYRPRYEDRNVVSYHPRITIKWGSHSNFLHISAFNWSFYILKYAVKCETAENLNLDIECAKRLGPSEVSENQLKTILALTMSRPVSCTLAAMAMLELLIIIRSSGVEMVSLVPPLM
jgi:hypothetical protein